jgi:hypothetical protein
MENNFNRDDLFQELLDLIDWNFLDQELFDVIMRNESPAMAAIALGCLIASELLTPENLELIEDGDGVIYCIIERLYDDNILTNENLNRLFDFQHEALLTSEAHEILWDNLPYDAVRRNFDAILEAATQPNPNEAFQILINQIINENEMEDDDIHLQAQNTHTASVHQSVSESAGRLLDRYNPNNPVVRANIQHILAFINSLDNTSPIHHAAKRAITRLTNVASTFIDPVSNISIRQLLALIFIAIHDDQNRQGTRADALALFVEGLYEIQRGYNLNESNEDDGEEDRVICMAGTFNKLVEKLVGIHPDVEIRLITRTQAAMMLPIVVREEAINYLKTLASTGTRETYLAFIQLITQINENGLEPIWAHIQGNVRQRLQDEFGTLYHNEDEFSDFIAAGIDTPIDNLEQFDNIVQQSSGFLAWQESQQTQAESVDFSSLLDEIAKDLGPIEEFQSMLDDLELGLGLAQSPNSFWMQTNTDTTERTAKIPRLG